MRRFVGESLEAFESLFRAAAAGEADFESAEYPPECGPPLGPLKIRMSRGGAVIVEVDVRIVACDDFRLDVLFARGSCLFARPSDLHAFWNGPVALAFGISAEANVSNQLEVDIPDGPIIVDDVPAQLHQVPSVRAGTASRAKRRRPGPACAPPSAQLAAAVSRRIFGQNAAVARIAAIVAAQLAKSQPQRPGTICLLGPTGAGKTATIEALPAALAETGYDGAHLYRIDCGEISSRGEVTRFLGCGPGYVGYEDTPPLYGALRKAGCVLLLDEFEKAHEELHAVVLALLDTGAIRTPAGKQINGAGSVIALTSNAAVEELEDRLHGIDLGNREAVDRISRDHLRDQGWPPELVGRIGAFAVFGPLDEAVLRPAAEQAIREQAREYGLTVVSADAVLADVVIELAARKGAGARALNHAAGDLLAEALADAARAGVRGRVEIQAGPPPTALPAA